MEAISTNSLLKLNRVAFGCKCYLRSSDKCRNFFDQLGISPADYLRPFVLASRKIELTSLAGKRRTISSFQVNFIDDREYRTPSKQQTEQMLVRAVERNQPNLLNINNQFQTSEEINTHLASFQNTWFDKGSEIILEQCRFAHQFSFIDQPAYLLNFITAEETDPAKTIKLIESETSIHLKEVFKNNPQDLSVDVIPSANFILCDCSNQRQVEASQKILVDLRQKYPQYLNRIIPINSSNSIIELQSWEASQETRYFSYPSVQMDRNKKILSQADFQTIMDTFSEFVMSYLVPNLDNKLKTFNHSYIAQKKNSISSTFKKLFNKNDQKPESGGAYQMTSFEILTRNIGDILYMLHDYEAAFDFYRHSAEAFKTKSYKHYACANEMMALSLIMAHQELKVPYSKNDGQNIVNYLREAIVQFNNQLNHVHFSLRCLIFKIHTQYIYDKFDVMINQQVLDMTYWIKERQDTPKVNQYPVFNAILQEQFALMQLKLQPARPRRYCQNLFYAGYQFGKCKLRAHALRCFLVVEKLYETAGWGQLHGFILKQLARYFIEIQEFPRGYQYAKLLLASINKNSAREVHEHTLDEVTAFITTLEKIPQFSFDGDQSVLPPYIPIPQIQGLSVDVVTQDEIIFSGDRSKQLPLPSLNQEILREIEQQERQGLIKHWGEMGLQLLSTSVNKSDLSRAELEREGCFLRSLSAQCTEDKLAAFDTKNKAEAMFRVCYAEELILVKFELFNPLKKKLRVEEFGLLYEFIPEGEENNQKSLLTEDKPSQQSAQLGTDSEFIKQQKNTFEIGEQKGLQVAVKMIPMKKGLLLLKGVQWKLFHIPIVYNFEFKGKIQKDGVTRMNNFSHRLQIFPQPGRLSIKALDFENIIYFGEISTLKLELRNEGATPINQLRIMFSEPYTYGKQDIDLSDRTILPGEAYVHKIPIRSSDPKLCQIRILIQYKTVGSPFFRYARFLQSIPVSPSFVLSWNTMTLFDANIIQLMVDDQIHNNFSKRKEVSLSASNVQKSSSVNLLDLDSLSDSNVNQSNSTQGDLLGSEGQNSNSNIRPHKLRVHQLILIDQNWRFGKLPYKVASAEQAYFWNIALDRPSSEGDPTQAGPSRSLSMRQHSKSMQQQHQTNDLIDLLLDGEDVGENNQQELQQQPQQSAQPTQQQQNQQKKDNNDDDDLISVEESDMHFLDLEKNIISNTFVNSSNQGEFGLDFETIKNFINFDRQLLFDRFWDKDQDFNHPDLVSLTAAWSYVTPEKTYYGLHGLPKIRINSIALLNSLRKLNPSQVCPLAIDLDYPQQVSHNFDKDPVCQVDIVVRIKNLYWEDNISFFFQCLSGDEPLPLQPQPGYPAEECSPQFMWEGETEKVISNLAYQNETRVNLRANFTKEGFFSLNKVKCTFYRNEETKQLVEPMAQRGQSSSRKIQERSYFPLEKEQFYINILNNKNK